MNNGILPSQEIAELLVEQRISSPQTEANPASLDILLNETTMLEIEAFELPTMDQTVKNAYKGIPCSKPQQPVMQPGKLYLIESKVLIRELPDSIQMRCNPKSTTGRLGIRTWVIGDCNPRINEFPAGYSGRLYTVAMPLHFPIDMESEGIALGQARFCNGDWNSCHLHEKLLHVATQDDGDGNVIGYRSVASSMAPATDVKAVDPNGTGYRIRNYPNPIAGDKPNEYFDPIYSCERLILEPGYNYLLGSMENVEVPPEMCAELVDYDQTIGDFRIHIAGFFDPNFGMGAPTKAVYEITTEMPVMLRHGQAVGKLNYERMTAVPDVLYGNGISNYQHQDVQPAKVFNVI